MGMPLHSLSLNQPRMQPKQARMHAPQACAGMLLPKRMLLTFACLELHTVAALLITAPEAKVVRQKWVDCWHGQTQASFACLTNSVPPLFTLHSSHLMPHKPRTCSPTSQNRS